MPQNNKKKFKLGEEGGFVFSTNPDFQFPQKQEGPTKAPKDQHLKVWLEKKGRGGKTASVIKGFVGKQDNLEELAKKLKGKCGTGGSVKDGEVIIQGDHRDKIVDFLSSQGFNIKKAGG